MIKKKKRRMMALGLGVLMAAALLPGLYNGLAVRRYSVEADGITRPVRIALLADLHSCRYGESGRELIAAVRAESPDLIAIAGDYFDDEIPDDEAERVLQGLEGIAPLFYVTGNHEYRAGRAAFEAKMAILERYGVIRLAGETVEMTANGQTFHICGVDDPDARLIGEAASFEKQLEAVRKDSGSGRYTVLLSHRPERMEEYVRAGFDLVLCGHAHGGQWRIPGLLNGLLAPNQGLFPPYAGGEYREGETVMIVSRGLARESTVIPRFYNRPELVVICLEPPENPR